MKQVFYIALLLAGGIVGWFLKTAFITPCPAITEKTVVNIDSLHTEWDMLLRPQIRKEILANLPPRSDSKRVKVDTLYLSPKEEKDSVTSLSAPSEATEWYVASADTVFSSIDGKSRAKVGAMFISPLPLSPDSYMRLLGNVEAECRDSVIIKEVRVPVRPSFYEDTYFWTTLAATAIAIAALLGGR